MNQFYDCITWKIIWTFSKSKGPFHSSGGGPAPPSYGRVTIEERYDHTYEIFKIRLLFFSVAYGAVTRACFRRITRRFGYFPTKTYSNCCHTRRCLPVYTDIWDHVGKVKLVGWSVVFMFHLLSLAKDVKLGFYTGNRIPKSSALHNRCATPAPEKLSVSYVEVKSTLRYVSIRCKNVHFAEGKVQICFYLGTAISSSYTLKNTLV